MIYKLVVNGIDNAFLRKFGCDCDRCRIKEDRTNTSISILAVDEKSNHVRYHVLVDIGLGVVNSLCCNFPLGQARLDIGSY